MVVMGAEATYTPVIHIVLLFWLGAIGSRAV